MRTLIIDNYDSYTWLLAQLVAQITGQMPLVVRNDEYRWDELQALGPFDRIIISPGPGSAEREADFHVSREAIAHTTVPLLGVCLGHQGIAHVFGGRIERAQEPMHGRLSRVHHRGDELFRGLSESFQAVRYHSRLVAQPLPDVLQGLAYTDEGLLMALRHRTRPLWGVQFHPESILTEGGERLLRNFFEVAHTQPRAAIAAQSTALPPKVPTHRVHWREISTALTSEDLFVGLYGAAAQAFWLDSALATEGLARFSFLGESDTQVTELSALEEDLAAHTVGGEDLPFAFRGGWVGYFAYEMKAKFSDPSPTTHALPYPELAWLQAHRFVAVDHHEGRCYLVAVGEDAAAQRWFTQTQARIRALAPAPVVQPLMQPAPAMRWDLNRNEYLQRIHASQNAIAEGESYEICLTNQLTVQCPVDGLALYRTLRHTNPAPYAAYLRIAGIEILSASPERFLQVDARGRIETKPIKGTAPRASDPQKDCALAEALRHSEKNRAENLMVVDLLRNDLSRVAEVGSVAVPKLMAVETYATVHQLVSTITAQLRADASLIDLIRATFPGGSITGAPKIRTMQWIDALERSARGVYCGSVGALGYNRVADLSIAIRTMVLQGDRITLGAGGAITALSNAQDEYDEVQLKAQALVRALSLYVCGEDNPRSGS